ncbi:hypothetical protein BD410DRAFT_586790 [Rickenella mellea]|uniref:F-box domain-containing protein n=1 Tax=Rickenella mellea TaxID=50990 RepID=A0A4Y7PPM6_9AGAM|nr:hypothetical protein BD410DRAFT_586790 [Rickenella mellea]
MTQTLPLETWTQILEHAGRVPITSPLQNGSHSGLCAVVPPPEDIQANLTTRLALTLVCRSFHAIVRPMIYEGIYISSLSMAWDLSGVLDDFFTSADGALGLGPRIWTKYLIFDINDPDPDHYADPLATVHIPTSRILRHCVSILGFGWNVRIASCPVCYAAPCFAFNMIECIPRGLEFFYSRHAPKSKSFMPLQVLRLNADSLRAIEVEDDSFVFKFSKPLLRVTHLTIMGPTPRPGSIHPRLLPSLRHLQVSDDPRPEFFEPFKDMLLSLHFTSGYVIHGDKLGLILQVLPKLEVLGICVNFSRWDLSSSLGHTPHLKELCIRAHDLGRLRSATQIFHDLGSYIRLFSADLFPALATITVSCDFPAVLQSCTNKDIDWAVQKLAQSLSSPNLRVTIDFVYAVRPGWQW